MKNYHLVIPAGMHKAIVDKLVEIGEKPDGNTVAIAGIAAVEAIQWHIENPLIPISEETKDCLHVNTKEIVHVTVACSDCNKTNHGAGDWQ